MELGLRNRRSAGRSTVEFADVKSSYVSRSVAAVFIILTVVVGE